MSFVADIQAVEARVVAAGHNVTRLCREAQIARTTWQRWKAGETSPTFRTWDQILKAADALCASVADEKGAA
jgi:DNA-binding phage protein